MWEIWVQPGLGRSPGEGKGYPLQYSGPENSMNCIVHGVTNSWTRLSDFDFHFLYLWASPVAQMVKNLPAMQKTWVQSLGQKDPLEKGMATCREPAWGTSPMTKVMRKEARHTQRWDRASGVPPEILKHLPPKPESAYFLLCAFTYTSDFTGAVPHHLFWRGS